MSGNANRAFRLVQFLGDDHIGLEARAQADDHQDVNSWLRLLVCCLQIESQVWLHFCRFGTMLQRFDFLAQLYRYPEGLSIRLLSRYLMVTGGNVTGLANQLVHEGLVERLDGADDRRCTRVRLTPKGRSEFAAMAAEHERWLIDLFKRVRRPPKKCCTSTWAFFVRTWRTVCLRRTHRRTSIT